MPRSSTSLNDSQVSDSIHYLRQFLSSTNSSPQRVPPQLPRPPASHGGSGAEHGGPRTTDRAWGGSRTGDSGPSDTEAHPRRPSPWREERQPLRLSPTSTSGGASVPLRGWRRDSRGPSSRRRSGESFRDLSNVSSSAATAAEWRGSFSPVVSPVFKASGATRGTIPRIEPLPFSRRFRTGSFHQDSYRVPSASQTGPTAWRPPSRRDASAFETVPSERADFRRSHGTGHQNHSDWRRDDHQQHQQPLPLVPPSSLHPAQLPVPSRAAPHEDAETVSPPRRSAPRPPSPSLLPQVPLRENRTTPVYVHGDGYEIIVGGDGSSSYHVNSNSNPNISARANTSSIVVDSRERQGKGGTQSMVAAAGEEDPRLPPPPPTPSPLVSWSSHHPDNLHALSIYLKHYYAREAGEDRRGLETLLPDDILGLAQCFYVDLYRSVREQRRRAGFTVAMFCAEDPDVGALAPSAGLSPVKRGDVREETREPSVAATATYQESKPHRQRSPARQGRGSNEDSDRSRLSSSSSSSSSRDRHRRSTRPSELLLAPSRESPAPSPAHPVPPRPQGTAVSHGSHGAASGAGSIIINGDPSRASGRYPSVQVVQARVPAFVNQPLPATSAPPSPERMSGYGSGSNHYNHDGAVMHESSHLTGRASSLPAGVVSTHVYPEDYSGEMPPKPGFENASGDNGGGMTDEIGARVLAACVASPYGSRRLVDRSTDVRYSANRNGAAEMNDIHQSGGMNQSTLAFLRGTDDSHHSGGSGQRQSPQRTPQRSPVGTPGAGQLGPTAWPSGGAQGMVSAGASPRTGPRPSSSGGAAIIVNSSPQRMSPQRSQQQHQSVRRTDADASPQQERVPAAIRSSPGRGKASPSHTRHPSGSGGTRGPHSGILKRPLKVLMPLMRQGAGIIKFVSDTRAPHLRFFLIQDCLDTFQEREVLMPHLTWSSIPNGVTPEELRVRAAMSQVGSGNDPHPPFNGMNASGSADNRNALNLIHLESVHVGTAAAPKLFKRAKASRGGVVAGSVVDHKGQPMAEGMCAMLAFKRRAVGIGFLSEPDRQVWLGGLMGVVERNRSIGV